jgi:solute carrier family 25 carnitine/acylcarnitine transporter 20/29
MLLAGGMAGVFSWVINFPIDTVKSIMQSDSLRMPAYRNSWHCFCTVTKEQGFLVLWKGFTPAIFRAFPLNAVTLCMYDWTQQRMKLSLKNHTN